MRARAGLAGRVVRIALGILLGFLLVEGAVRISGFPPRPLLPPQIEGRIPVLPLGEGLFVYQPNSTFSYRYDPAGDPSGYFGPDGRIVYRINNAGFRGRDVPEHRIPGTVRVLCLGDSYTFGEGVQEGDTWPAQLETILNGSGHGPKFEVINAGIQALGTRLEERLLRGLLAFQPDVVVLGFFMNDAMPDAATISIQEQRVEDQAASGRCPSRVIAFLRERLRARRRQESYLQSIAESFQGASWDSCRVELGRIKSMSDAAGIRLLVVVFPVLWGLEGNPPLQAEHARVDAACESLGCPPLDLLAVFRGRSSRSLWAHPTDPHPNREAQRLAAQAIAEELRRE